MSKFWKLTPVVTLATVIALLAAGVLMAYMSERSYKDQKSREITAQAQILGSTVTAALVFNDREAAQEYVNALAANPEIRAAAIFHGGAKFAAYRRSYKEILPQPGPDYGPRISDGRIEITTPILHGGRQIGSVYLHSGVEPLSNRILRFGGIDC